MRATASSTVALVLATVVIAGPQFSSGSDLTQQSQTTGSACPLFTACYPEEQCNPDGVIDTTGSFGINPRIKVKLQPCYGSDPNVRSVCCRFPEPLPVVNCPAYADSSYYCEDEVTCPFQDVLYDANDLEQRCYQNTLTAKLGVCCKSAVAQPLTHCPPSWQYCIPHTDYCSGLVYSDNTGVKDCVLGSGGVGQCCSNPPKPEPLTTCPGAAVCKPLEQCSGSHLTNVDGTLTECYGVSGVLGVCCLPPPPCPYCTRKESCVPSSIVPKPAAGYQNCQDPNVCCTDLAAQSCPHDHVCASECANTGGVGIINARTFCLMASGAKGQCCKRPEPSEFCPEGYTCKSSTCYDLLSTNPYGEAEECYVAGLDQGSLGYCCTDPIVNTCPHGQECLVPSLCQGHPTDLSSYSACLAGTNQGVTGVCCQPEPEPKDIYDTCPFDTVCLPDELCHGILGQSQGEVCALSGSGHVRPGVCCQANFPELGTYPNPERCGIRNEQLDVRVQNFGHENQAGFAEFPWASILFYTNFTFACAATIIGESWLLTAAHCVNGYFPYDLKVRMGEWQVDSYDEPLQYEDSEIASISIHPEFDPKTLANDIALLELFRPVVFRHHINAACLPIGPDQFADGTYCFASGWGKDSFDGGNYQAIPKKVDLPLLHRRDCQNKLRRTELGSFFRLHPSFLCAGGEAGKDTCTGDGGGPLVCYDQTRDAYFLMGLVSWGLNCGVQNEPGVYTNVPYFLKWIEAQIASKGLPPTQLQTGYGK